MHVGILNIILPSEQLDVLAALLDRGQVEQILLSTMGEMSAVGNKGNLLSLGFDGLHST